ncbi:MAG: hypothetical protein WCD70_12200 [Alphaproteobacteria bacterium]
MTKQLIFVDCEDTVWLQGGQRINQGLLTALDRAAEAGHEVVFFTGGDATKYQWLLRGIADQLPPCLAKSGRRGGLPRLESKRDMRDLCLPVVIDDTPQEQLTQEYKFTSEHYICAKGQTEAAYYIQKLTEILGPLPPGREPASTPPAAKARRHPG